MAAFFVRPMPQESDLTAVHLVTDAIIFIALRYRVLLNRSPSVEYPPAQLLHSTEQLQFELRCMTPSHFAHFAQTLTTRLKKYR